MFCYGTSMNINILLTYLLKIYLTHFMALVSWHHSFFEGCNPPLLGFWKNVIMKKLIFRKYCGFQGLNVFVILNPAGTVTLWQRCDNIVVDVVTTLWHGRKWELYRRQFPTLWQRRSPTLSRRCLNVATTSPQH